MARLSGIARIGLLLVATACSSKPLLTYSIDTPPMILVPASYAGVTDGRGRFREIYDAVRELRGHEFPDDRPTDEALHRMATEPEPTGRPVHLGDARLPLRILVIPGLFGELLEGITEPFRFAREHVESLGYRTGLVMVDGRSSSEHNATEIRDAFAELEFDPDERVILVGYSKGTTDALVALTTYPEVRDRVTALVAVAGVVGGTPVASGVPGLLESFVTFFPVPGYSFGAGSAIESLERSTCQNWLAANRLPDTVRYFSLPGFAERDRISSMLRSSYDDLAFVDPRNDGEIVFYDAILPGSTLLGFANADHLAIALPIARTSPIISGVAVTHNEFPREVLLEAIVRFVEESLLDAERER